MTTSPNIGRLAEKSLHAALKAQLATPGDQMEARYGGYVVDILRDGLVIEVQTGNFSGAKRKLTALLDHTPVRLVHPVAAETWIARITPDGELISRRKSPKRGTIYEMFRELVRLPLLALHPRFSFDVMLTHEEQVWVDDGAGSWRRKRWSIADRRLLGVVSHAAFESVTDYNALLPFATDTTFTTGDLAVALKIDRGLAGKMAYTLREMGVIVVDGKQGKAFQYRSACQSE